MVVWATTLPLLKISSFAPGCALPAITAEPSGSTRSTSKVGVAADDCAASGGAAAGFAGSGAPSSVPAKTPARRRTCAAAAAALSGRPRRKAVVRSAAVRAVVMRRDVVSSSDSGISIFVSSLSEVSTFLRAAAKSASEGTLLSAKSVVRSLIDWVAEAARRPTLSAILAVSSAASERMSPALSAPISTLFFTALPASLMASPIGLPSFEIRGRTKKIMSRDATPSTISASKPALLFFILESPGISSFSHELRLLASYLAPDKRRVAKRPYLQGISQIFLTCRIAHSSFPS